MSKLILNVKKTNEVHESDPVELENGVIVKLKKVISGDNVEVRGVATKNDIEVGRIAFIKAANNFYMNIDVKELGDDAIAVGDALYDGFSQLINE